MDQNVAKKDFLSRVKNFGLSIYQKLVKIDDSPQKVAIGFGVGVTLGIFPGVGPIASVVLAALFRINKLAALTGSLLTNTWLSVVTFLLAVKVGSRISGRNWQDVYEECKLLFQDFSWRDLFDVSLLRILQPVFIGYVLVSLAIGIFAYFVVTVLLTFKRRVAH